jgi:hypothetical protein
MRWLKPAVTSVLLRARVGARALAEGSVQVFRNGDVVAEYDVASWPHAAKGGYIGIRADIAGKVESYDDFGGGDYVCEN